MALFRALESARPASERLFADPYAAQACSLTDLASASGAGRPASRDGGRYAQRSIVWPGTRSSGVVRTRLIDDLVDEDLAAGVRQFVLLGAGLDSRPYRLDSARRAEVFEVDHPATQQVKRSRLGTVAQGRAQHVRFVAVDFERHDLGAALLAAGFDTHQATVVLWEGVVSYLTTTAVEHTLATIADLTCSSSRLVFTYWRRSALEGSLRSAEAERWMARVRRSGEPFVFGFEPEEVGSYLRPFGFALEVNISTAEAARRYPQAVVRRESGSWLYYVASATRS